MSDQETYVTVAVGGKKYTAITRITVQYAANQAARAFAFTVTDATDAYDDRWDFKPGVDCTIYANDQLLVTGIIDKMTPTFDGKDHKVEVSGRSKSKDMIDSSVDHATSEFRNMTPVEVAKAINYTVAAITSDIQLPKMEFFRLNSGESIWAAIDRSVRRFGALLQGTADGGLIITKGGTGGSNSPLIEGVNVLSGSATFDESDGHSKIKIKGQRTLGHNKKAIDVSASAEKKGRKRTKVLHPETDIDSETAKKRAKHHSDKQEGHSTTAELKSQSWFDSDGQLWKANGLVYVSVPMLKLDMQMLIKSVQLQQGENGTEAVLSLTLPQAYGGTGTGKGGGKGKTGSNTDASWIPKEPATTATV